MSGPAGGDRTAGVVAVAESGMWARAAAVGGEPRAAGNGSASGVAAARVEAAAAWHEAGLANGGTACEDPPGVRDGDMGPIHLAYLRDPSGNKICTLLRV